MKIVLIVALASLVHAESLSGTKMGNSRSLPSACGNNRIEFSARKSDKPAPAEHPTDKAIVYVFSKLNYGGIPIGCQVVSRIGVDGKWVGANCGTSYVETIVDPGEHHLCSDWQSRVRFGTRPGPALLGFSAAVGKAYYFRTTIVYQAGTTDLTLESVGEDEGKYLLSSSPASESTPKH